MKYKLLVLDVDGTLLNEEKVISKRTLSALLKVQQTGVRIALASGRPPMGCSPSPSHWNWGYTEVSSCPITAPRSSMPRTAKSCSNGVSIPK